MLTRSRHRNILDWSGLLVSSVFILALTFGLLH